MSDKQPKPLGRPPVYGERRAFNIAIPVALADKLDAWRAAKGLSRAAAVQQLIERALKKVQQ